VDLGRLTGLLEGAGYSGWYVLEQDIVIETEPQEGEGPVVNVRKSLGFLERRLEALGEQEGR
jgi:inosose dehydratase